MKKYKYKINGSTYNVAIGDIEGNIAQVEVNGTPYKVEFDKAPETKAVVAPRPATGEKVIKAAPAATGKYTVKSPLPGVIMSVLVKVGDTVKASDTVISLEAMKMENAIHAGRDGKVTSIDVNVGDSVLEGHTLVTIE